MNQQIEPHASPTAALPQGSTARPFWRTVLSLLLLLVCWLAFTPNPPPQADTGWDKMNHLLAFSVLAVCAWMGWTGARHRLAGAAAGLVAFGIFIEIVQTGIPGRSGEWPDLLADTLGIAIGLMAGRLIEGLQRQLAARRTQG